jgi:hypothetical protein
MTDDNIITLDTGEQVKVGEDGERYLILGPDPEIEDVMAKQPENQILQNDLQQEQLAVLAEKQEQQAINPAVPPEKTIF